MGKTKAKPDKKTEAPKPASPKVETLGLGESQIQFEVLTLEEAAALLRISPDGLATDAREGRIPAFFVAGEWRFAKSVLYGRLVSHRVNLDPSTQTRPPAGVGEFYDEDPEAVIAAIYAERKKHPVGE